MESLKIYELVDISEIMLIRHKDSVLIRYNGNKVNKVLFKIPPFKIKIMDSHGNWFMSKSDIPFHAIINFLDGYEFFEED